MLDGATQSPELVAAWLALDDLRVERVPMWAADWLVQGYDGPLSSVDAALKVAFDHIAHLHVSGRARWTWVVNQVVEVVAGTGYADEAFEHPLGQLYAVDDDMSEPWSRSDEELGRVVRQACLDQIAGAGPSV